MSPSPNPLVTLANMYGIIIPTNSDVMYVLASGVIKNIFSTFIDGGVVKTILDIN